MSMQVADVAKECINTQNETRRQVPPRLLADMHAKNCEKANVQQPSPNCTHQARTQMCSANVLSFGRQCTDQAADAR